MYVCNFLLLEGNTYYYVVPWYVYTSGRIVCLSLAGGGCGGGSTIINSISFYSTFQHLIK